MPTDGAAVVSKSMATENYNNMVNLFKYKYRRKQI
jgi:hypothetical protein